jgi:hypothetical protein
MILAGPDCTAGGRAELDVRRVPLATQRHSQRGIAVDCVEGERRAHERGVPI